MTSPAAEDDDALVVVGELLSVEALLPVDRGKFVVSRCWFREMDVLIVVIWNDDSKDMKKYYDEKENSAGRAEDSSSRMNPELV